MLKLRLPSSSQAALRVKRYCCSGRKQTLGVQRQPNARARLLSNACALAQVAARMKEAKGKKGAVVKEKAPKVQVKDIKKRKGVLKEAKVKKPKPVKKVKDPNVPKRPQTAFFIFLNDFRTTFKEEYPEVKGVAAVGKAGGERWKSMSEADKQPFLAKAAQKKAEYDRTIASYKQKQEDDVEEAEAEDSDKSKSEIHDDDEDEEEEEDVED